MSTSPEMLPSPPPSGAASSPAARPTPAPRRAPRVPFPRRPRLSSSRRMVAIGDGAKPAVVHQGQRVCPEGCHPHVPGRVVRGSHNGNPDPMGGRSDLYRRLLCREPRRGDGHEQHCEGEADYTHGASPGTGPRQRGFMALMGVQPVQGPPAICAGRMACAMLTDRRGPSAGLPGSGNRERPDSPPAPPSSPTAPAATRAMSRLGSPATATRSASRPGSMVPRSSRSRISAFPEVAARRTASGAIPYSYHQLRLEGVVAVIEDADVAAQAHGHPRVEGGPERGPAVAHPGGLRARPRAPSRRSARSRMTPPAWGRGRRRVPP